MLFNLHNVTSQQIVIWKETLFGKKEFASIVYGYPCSPRCCCCIRSVIESITSTFQLAFYFHGKLFKLICFRFLVSRRRRCCCCCCCISLSNCKYFPYCFHGNWLLNISIFFRYFVLAVVVMYCKEFQETHFPTCFT